LSYPVRLEGTLQAQLSRWLWLVKWLLIFPHVVILLFLGVAAVVLTIIAFFAILVTGRYPRGIFDFNVGALRWLWRVSYYSYGALGTDRYPPFTLADVPDYPARLEIAYPERLSRGLVLVKWLLAIPHLLVISAADNVGTLLTLFAGVVVLFTGRYPQGMFDFIMGINRWVFRVIPYVALMTDEYPPFRLDQGGSEPAG
jgi:hypothetical protein